MGGLFPISLKNYPSHKDQLHTIANNKMIEKHKEKRKQNATSWGYKVHYVHEEIFPAVHKHFNSDLSFKEIGLLS